MGQTLTIPGVPIPGYSVDSTGARLKGAARAGQDSLVREIAQAWKGKRLSPEILNWSGATECGVFAVEEKDKRDGATPLIVACKNGHYICVNVLASTPGVKVNKTDPDGRTGLHHASLLGFVEVASVLVQFSNVTYIQRINAEADRLSTMAASSSSRATAAVDAVYLEVERVDLNKGDNLGKTSLHLACGAGKLEVVKLLAETTGVDVNRGDTSGTTPLLEAIYSNNSNAAAVIVFLLSVTVSASTGSVKIPRIPMLDVNRADKIGMIPIIYAAREGKTEVVKLLALHPEIDPNKMCEGRTALHWAVANSSSSTLKALLTIPGIDVNRRDDKGFAPREYATSEEMKLLLAQPVPQLSRQQQLQQQQQLKLREQQQLQQQQQQSLAR